MSARTARTDRTARWLCTALLTLSVASATAAPPDADVLDRCVACIRESGRPADAATALVHRVSAALDHLRARMPPAPDAPMPDSTRLPQWPPQEPCSPFAVLLAAEPALARAIGPFLVATYGPEALAADEDELRDLYQHLARELSLPEMAHARHILVAAPPGSGPATRDTARVRAERTRQRILAGEDFATTAREISDCPSRSAGGDLGLITPGQLHPRVSHAIFTQEPGVCGPPIEGAGGWHLVQVIERWGPRPVPYAIARSKLAEQVERRKATRLLARLLADAGLPATDTAPGSDVKQE